MSDHLFLFAGEASGDMHGGRLLESLQGQMSDLKAVGVGGPAMRRQGLDCLLPMEEFAVMGFSDVLAALPRLATHFYRIRNHILETQPKGVVLIDYPGFTLRLARSLRKKGYTGKIIHYIAPTVWAHGKGRADLMGRTTDLLLTIYPFEAAHFSHTPLRVEYCGNPLVAELRAHAYDPNWKQAVGLPSDQPFLALFPGSRVGEIRRNLPKILEAASRLRADHPGLQLALSVASEELETIIRDIAPQGVHLVPKRYTYEMMREARAAVAKSGTVTLELALHGCPTVVVYELTALNRFIARYVMRLNLPFYCIVNILAGSEVFPELIKDGYTADTLHAALKGIYEDGPARNTAAAGCRSVKDLLGDGDAGQAAAHYVAKELQC